MFNEEHKKNFFNIKIFINYNFTLRMLKNSFFKPSLSVDITY